MTEAEFDVVVVGYGPTGLVLASVLGRAGHRVAVVERWPTLYGLPRLSHIDGETARIIQCTADVDQALRDSVGIDKFTFFNAQGEVLTAIGSSEMGPLGYPRDISIFQPDIEDAIDAAVKACPNVEKFLGYEVVALQPHGGGASVEIVPTGDHAAEPMRFRGRFVVGCDGARSFVREALGIERVDYGFNERWLNIDTRRLRPLPPIFDTTVQFCDPARGHMHLIIGSKRVRFELALLTGENAEEFSKPEFAWTWLRAQHDLDPEDVEIIRQIVYTFQARIAERWRDGAVFLAGDAAHTMPPYLGQGACSGMRDGLNLGWKLDLVLRGVASSDLLDSYEIERRPHVTTITEMAIQIGRIANEHDPVRARARDEALRANPPKQPAIPNILDGLLAPERTPLVGTIWPQGRVTFRGHTGRFDTVVGNGFVLMSTAGLEDVLGKRQVEGLARIGCHIVNLSDPEFQDLEGIYERYFSANGITAILARPDFVVFGTAQNLAGIGPLVDGLLAGLAGKQHVELATIKEGAL